WIANRLVWNRPWRSLLVNRLVLFSGSFVVFAFASVLWAREAGLAYAGAFTLAQYAVWALMIADLARSPLVITHLVRVLVLSGSLAAGITFQQYLAGARRAGDQIGGGVN